MILYCLQCEWLEPMGKIQKTCLSGNNSLKPSERAPTWGWWARCRKWCAGWYFYNFGGRLKREEKRVKEKIVSSGFWGIYSRKLDMKSQKQNHISFLPQLLLNTSIHLTSPMQTVQQHPLVHNTRKERKGACKVRFPVSPSPYLSIIPIDPNLLY